MGYKNSDPCIKKAFDDERLFVLMARDGAAPFVVVDWIKQSLLTQPSEKLHEALDAAIEMAKRSMEFKNRVENQKKRKKLVKKISESLRQKRQSVFCLNCGGDGYIKHSYDSERDKCETCNGSGKNPDYENDECCGRCDGVNDICIADRCKTCKGTGELHHPNGVGISKCLDCKGTGLISPKVRYEICDQCDGCGWYEGGPYLKTTCNTCNGSGKIKKYE